jgi:uncharacterized membrane protein YeaQ/YmgE (transglycosylase-associated protein family)
MHIIYTIIIGFIVGLLARAIMPGKDPLGFIVTTLVGIAGAMLGGFIGQAMGWAAPGEPTSLFASVMGALLIVFVVSVARPKHLA